MSRFSRPHLPYSIIGALLILLAGNLVAQESWSRAGGEARVMVLQGSYEAAAEFASEHTRYRRADPQVTSAWLDALVALGRYDEAAGVAEDSAEVFEGFIPAQVQAIEVLRMTGRSEKAAELLKGLDALAKQANPDNLNAEELVALGRAALLLGAQPKLVQTQFFQRAQKMEERGWLAHVATAELALEKGDYALAARVLNEARTRVGPLSDLLYLQARAYAPSDREKAEQFLTEALEQNPRHLPSLLLRAQHAIDFEDYENARATLAEVRETNPHHPLAWAFEAAICFILDQEAEGNKARATALKPSTKNPEVDYWIGHKISQMRRFAEGAEFLRQALAMDPGHLPSKKALGQDLLRLGHEKEGWAFIEEVRKADPYDVEVYNLMLLHDQLETFVMLEDGGFKVRMRPEEAAVYGPRVLELLAEANEKLGKKYGFQPSPPVVVDFFPDQQDFAVRTLGIPGGLGILGACFGNVVAMNSPGSPGAMGSNWESTLWHEFCHSITLGATDSRIPRWLTEGISVYEERQRDASSASKMTPAFRRRILGEDEGPGLIPLSDLSAALTAFSDPETISFAYYQSSLIVEYMLETWGAQKFQRVLNDLRTNGVVGEVLRKHMASEEKIDAGFDTYVKARARKVAPKIDWDVPEAESPLHRDPRGVEDFLAENPNNLWALSTHAANLLNGEKWQEAKKPAQTMIDLFPEYVGEGNGYGILAQACRALEDTDGERKALRAWAERDGDANDAFLRLVELDLASRDWEALAWSARRVLSVNPMLRTPHRALGMAAQEQGESDAAIRSFEALLHLDPINPADVHYRLGGLYRERDSAKARRHVLLALEEAPRFREAYALLRELTPDETPEPSPAP